jgi:hypothetical protein
MGLTIGQSHKVTANLKLMTGTPCARVDIHILLRENSAVPITSNNKIPLYKKNNKTILQILSSKILKL